ncbi:MAG: hypothetical protein MHMPM18_001039 [Marteilia pararefringens]
MQYTMIFSKKKINLKIKLVRNASRENNQRLYCFLLLIFLLVSTIIGNKFVEIFTNVALICLYLSFLSFFIGLVLNKDLKYCSSQSGYIVPNQYGCDKSVIINGRLDIWTTKKFIKTYNLNENLKSVYNKPLLVIRESQNTYTLSKHDHHESFTYFIGLFYAFVSKILFSANSKTLEDPQKNIPIGIISAVFSGILTYFIFGTVMILKIPRTSLIDYYGFSMESYTVFSFVSWPSRNVSMYLILYCSLTISLTFFSRSYNILSTLFSDNSGLKKQQYLWISKRFGETEIGISLICFLFVLIETMIPNFKDFLYELMSLGLNVFLYINAVCFWKSYKNDPDWRPNFRIFHWSVSLLGALMILVLMFIVVSEKAYFIINFFLPIILYKLFEFFDAKDIWGDARHGLALNTAHKTLWYLTENKMHAQNYRCLLQIALKPVLKDEISKTFEGMSEYDLLLDKNEEIIFDIVNLLKSGKALTIVTQIFECDLKHNYLNIINYKNGIVQYLKNRKIKAFVKTAANENIECAAHLSTQSPGLGGLKPNTIAIPWPESEDFKDQISDIFYKILIDSIVQEYSIIIAKGSSNLLEYDMKIRADSLIIDIWTTKENVNFNMMLAHLIKRFDKFQQIEICVNTMIKKSADESEIKEIKKFLKNFLYLGRFQAKINVFREIEENDDNILFNFKLESYNEKKICLLRMAKALNNNIQDRCNLNSSKNFKTLVLVNISHFNMSMLSDKELLFDYISTITRDVECALITRSKENIVSFEL